MKKYEITYLISDDVTDSEITRTTGKVSGIIFAADGKVEKEESWGRRKLAYPIDKKEFATYVTINFEIDPLSVNSVTKDIRMMKEVVRLIAVLVDEKKTKTTLTEDDIAATTEIENVVGSDKSFEAVEGQTKDSYDLMAKRSETDLTDEPKNERTDKLKNKKTEKQKEPVSKDSSQNKEEMVEADKEKTVKPTKKVAPKKKAPAKKKAAPKKEDTAKDEADRLNKLDKELDDLLGDDL